MDAEGPAFAGPSFFVGSRLTQPECHTRTCAPDSCSPAQALTLESMDGQLRDARTDGWCTRSMLEIRNVSHEYPGPQGPVHALRGLSLTVESGQVVALLGANGSGKSTLVRLCNGIMLPSAGTVSVDGIPTTDPTRVWDVRSKVGVVFQDPDNQIVGTVVEEDVAFGPENLGVARDELRVRVDDALAAVGLSGLERREPHLLSGGQKQRLAIAGALAMRPSYLVLDEPTSMLDPQGRSDVLSIITRLRASGTGILHVTHDLADVFDSDAVIVLSEGEVAFSGPPAALLAGEVDLALLGLHVPAIWRLASELRSLGAPVPDAARDASSIGAALWG